jgi:RecA/RadA recombinase
MIGSLAERLQAARWGSVVGRSAERALVRDALMQDILPFNILYVYGPGGVGKTTLLQQLLRDAQDAGVQTAYLDLRNVDPTPQTFVAALQRALGADDPAAHLAALGGRVLLLFDTFELFAPLEFWLRTVWLEGLPAQTLCVFAGRDDPGWQSLIRSLPLRNLSPDESREYLNRRTVPSDQLPAVLRFTRGHPLALSLVADSFAQRGGFRFEGEDTLDVIKTLIDRFVEHVPSPAHRAALELCALVRLTSESLLAAALPETDAHALFDWLRGLSLIEAHRDGLFPHDLARDALATDLRWRNSDWYVELHKRARGFYLGRLGNISTREQQGTLIDFVYLHRDNPLIQPFFDWQMMSAYSMSPMQPEDYAAIKDMTLRHEGETSATIANYWLSRKPQGVLVCRDPHGAVAGFMMMLPLHEIADEGSAFDPAVASCWRYVQTHAPLRQGEIATLFRFWMADDTYQDISPVQSLVLVNVVRHYLSTAGLAFTFVSMADPDFYAPGFAYANIPRLPGADFVVGGRRYGVFGSDWRALPPLAWLTLLAEREVGREPPPLTHVSGASLEVLAYEDFIEATRQGLRDMTRPDLLRLNPLLRSRMITARVGIHATDSERAAALAALLREGGDALRESNKTNKSYRALYHTYYQPAETQEAAAELLDMPFSTYRRHLKAGVDYVVETLWMLEVGG